jgi:preprotein translocase subunit SecA
VKTSTQEYQRPIKPPPRLLKGADAAVHGFIGLYRRRSGILHELRAEADQIDALAPSFQALSKHHLQHKLRDFHELFRRKKSPAASLLIQSLAALREAAHREIGLRPFPVQLMGALALHRGFLAEMATGEGKTLTAGLAAVLAGWTGRPCHVITVNDYLVARDALWLKNLYQFCGLSVGTVTGPMEPDERKSGYAASITYSTSKEILADFLRDRLQSGSTLDSSRQLIRHMLRGPMPAVKNTVMRGIYAAIVDEADSLLIDEAVTPLIISASCKNEMLKEAVRIAHNMAESLQPHLDYSVNLRYREIELTRAGRQKIESRCAHLPGLWQGPQRRLELIRQALSARELFHSGKQYIIENNRIVIVDEFTGRPMPQRTWQQGMHQAIEAKEALPITDPTETMARLSFQRFFRLYERLSGMTGTAHEAAAEFWQIYRLPVLRLPTHKPCIRRHWPHLFFPDEISKWNRIAQEIERVHATGRPILVGTRNVNASERLATLLRQRHLPFSLLNAIHHQEEARIIADAGLPGRITIATNMAGRGTDIKLGQGVAEIGGLHVIATERHESQRVDRQLFGRSARQGDPGSSQAFASAEDELLQSYIPNLIRQPVAFFLRHKLPGHQRVAHAALLLSQYSPQKLAYRRRRNVLRRDDWLEDSLSFAGPDPLA